MSSCTRPLKLGLITVSWLATTIWVCEWVNSNTHAGTATTAQTTR